MIGESSIVRKDLNANARRGMPSAGHEELLRVNNGMCNTDRSVIINLGLGSFPLPKSRCGIELQFAAPGLTLTLPMEKVSF